MLKYVTVSSARPYNQSSRQQMQSTPVNAKIMKKCKHRQKIRFIQCLSLLWILASFSSVTIAQNDSRTVEDGGTGDYKALMISDNTLPTHTVFRPENLSAFGSDKKRSEEHTSELQSRGHLVCRLLLEKKK